MRTISFGSKWIMMKTGGKNTLLKLLDSKLAMTLDVIIDDAHEDGSWTSTALSRSGIINKVHISPPTCFRYIKTLSEKEILLHQGRGQYKLNPIMIKMKI